MKTFVLLMILWTPGRPTDPHFATSAEFNSQETCEAAIRAAHGTFDGYSMQTYAVCTPK